MSGKFVGEQFKPYIQETCISESKLGKIKREGAEALDSAVQAATASATAKAK
jgi:hypothetical protein